MHSPIFAVPRLAPAAAVLAALTLTACAPPGPAYVVYDPIPTPTPVAPAQRLPEAQPVVPRVDLEMEDGLPVPVNASCMSAVAERAGDYNVRVLGNETVARGTEVIVGVGEDMTRWRCVANSSGELIEVSNASRPEPRAVPDS